MTPDVSLWQDTATEHFSAPPLDGERRVDLCVVGGGYTGCSAALHAARSGASVALLEAETIGHGGSGRNVGLVNAGLWTPPDDIASLLPDGAGERLTATLAAAPDLVFSLVAEHGIGCEPVRNGTLHLAHSRGGLRDLEARHAQLSARGAPVELLDAGATAGRAGTGAFHGALFDPRAGTIQPLAYVRGLARAARDMEAEIFERSPAGTITRDGEGWHIRTEHGAVRAGALILATDAYHRPLAGPNTPRMVPVNFFQAATAPLGPEAAEILPGAEGCWDTGLVMTSLRRDAAGRVIIGAIGGLDAPGRALHLGWARRKLAALFPALRGAPFERFTRGRIAMTGDHLPRIQRLGPKALAAFGYSGRGIGPGTLFGKAMADSLLSGKEDTLPLAPVSAHRDAFPALRGIWIEAGASLVHALRR